MFSTFRQNLSHTPGDTRGKGAAGTCPPQGPEPRCPGPQPRADFAQHPCVLWSPPPGRTPKHASSALSSCGVGGRNKGPQGETESWGQAASASRTAGRKSSSGVRPSDPGKTTGHPHSGARPPCLLLWLQPAVLQVRPRCGAQEPRGEAQPQVSEVGEAGRSRPLGAAELLHSASHTAAP